MIKQRDIEGLLFKTIEVVIFKYFFNYEGSIDIFGIYINS